MSRYSHCWLTFSTYFLLESCALCIKLQNFVNHTRKRAIQYWYEDHLGSDHIPANIDFEAFFDQKLWRLYPVAPKHIYEANEAKAKAAKAAREAEEAGGSDSADEDSDEEVPPADTSMTPSFSLLFFYWQIQSIYQL